MNELINLFKTKHYDDRKQLVIQLQFLSQICGHKLIKMATNDENPYCIKINCLNILTAINFLLTC